VLVPVLKDAGESDSTFGQLIIASATIADVILLSLFFSREAGSTASKAILLGGLVVVAVLVGLLIAGVEHSLRLRDVLRRLQDTTAQIRIRGAFVLLIGLVALATELGLEVILGAFIAGAIIALVVVRGLPALLYRSVIPRTRLPVAVLMQATSLPFIVAATAVGLALDVVSPANAAARIAAGLLSVVVFPAVSLALLRRARPYPNVNA
jgi:hypothetical protein